MDDDSFTRIMAGLGEALADAEGEKVPGLRRHVDEIDVAAVRRLSGLSPEAFSTRIGVPLSTLHGWEQGLRRPEGPARILLAMLARNPHIVEETLGSAA